MIVLSCSLAGATGAVCRYLIAGWIHDRSRSMFPIGTLMVNLLGSFGLGAVVGNGDLDSLWALAAVGFFGGLTTFSTWMVETARLGPSSSPSILNVVASLGGGVLAAAIGFGLTS